MKPVSPVVPGLYLDVTVYAKYQPPYMPLPTFKYEDGAVLMRWHMTFWESLVVLIFGDVYVWLQTSNQPLQPITLQVYRPKKDSQ